MGRRNDQEETLLQFIIDVLINSVVIILVFFFVQRFVVAPFQVIGSSMINTLQSNEFILVSKLEYLFGSPERGDIVVFHPPNNVEEYYIKRIIGVPGDVVRLKAGEVFVNDQKLEESYLREGLRTCIYASSRACEQDDKEYIVPEGRYFVLGDNRSGSSDSRAWVDEENHPLSFVPLDQIQGKTRLVVYPLPNIRWLKETNAFEALEAQPSMP